MKKYQAILFSLDGESLLDFHDRESIEDVWDEINDMGSKWYFYPLCAVIRDYGCTDKNQRIIDCPREYDFLKRKSIKTVSKIIKNDDVYFNYLITGQL